jgi:hypothetical protein
MKSNSPIESFRTHSNYLRAISSLILGPNSSTTTNPYENIARQIASSGLITENLRDNFDIDQARTCLQSAWGTEALLLMTGNVFREEEVIRLSNNWSAIQTYYVMYHCAQALHVAQGHPRPENHPKTQNAFHNQWANRPGFLHPWTFAYGSLEPINIPHDVNIDLNIHSWSTCVGHNTWSLYAKALMTTRRDNLLEKNRKMRERKKQSLRRSWEEEETRRRGQGKKPRKQPSFPLPQLTPDDKSRIEESTRAFTLIDYIYRLRMKTNYEDSNMFTDGPEDSYQSALVRSAFYNIASGTLFLYENAIKAIVGRSRLIEWAVSWAERNLPSASALGIAGRREHH